MNGGGFTFTHARTDPRTHRSTALPGFRVFVRPSIDQSSPHLTSPQLHLTSRSPHLTGVIYPRSRSRSHSQSKSQLKIKIKKNKTSTKANSLNDTSMVLFFPLGGGGWDVEREGGLRDERHRILVRSVGLLHFLIF